MIAFYNSLNISLHNFMKTDNEAVTKSENYNKIWQKKKHYL